MCLVILSWKNDPDFPLLISANRDEFFDRPTASLHQWNTGIYAGRDLVAGGTWMGFHPNGKWAILTNYRDFKNPKKGEVSRGKLVSDFLNKNIPLEDYADQVEGQKSMYDGFNLLISDGYDLFYISNYSSEIQIIQPGIHAISNGLINDPWPKCELGKSQLFGVLNQEIEEENLLNILKSTETFPLESLPKTGVSDEKEILLSAQMIRMPPDYGTVSSTAVIREKSGLTRIKERKYAWDFTKYEDTFIRFQL